jgi:hypothetical protein
VTSHPVIQVVGVDVDRQTTQLGHWARRCLSAGLSDFSAVTCQCQFSTPPLVVAREGDDESCGGVEDVPWLLP